jgi:hypothetical protein
LSFIAEHPHLCNMSVGVRLVREPVAICFGCGSESRKPGSVAFIHQKHALQDIHVKQNKTKNMIPKQKFNRKQKAHHPTLLPRRSSSGGMVTKNPGGFAPTRLGVEPRTFSIYDVGVPGESRCLLSIPLDHTRVWPLRGGGWKRWPELGLIKGGQCFLTLPCGLVPQSSSQSMTRTTVSCIPLPDLR